ncbi:MAG: hypothetical protein RLZZ500_1139 [Bacteroidota bacterium]|jgi:hypothetical protein
MYKPFYLLALLFCSYGFAQSEETLKAQSIPDLLKENANSVVRFEKIDVTINSVKSYTISHKRVITVLNKRGENDIDAYLYYSPSEKVNALQLTVYNAQGIEIKKIRRGDFIDQSVSDGYSILTDNRILFANYTPIEYPLTFVFESELKSINTAFLPTWMPVDNYFSSVEFSEITYRIPSELRYQVNEKKLSEFGVQKVEKEGVLAYQIQNIRAEKPEDFSPSTDDILPCVRISVNPFFLEGIEGNATNWEGFGKWMYNGLLTKTDELSPETIEKVKQITSDLKDPIAKARKVYEFVQGRTRYISIQLGIGGWRPMLAKDVDRLGYGDCKALTNYTRALLNVVGVESYYTLIYGSSNRKDIKPDFVAMQGNHAVLALPDGKAGYYFLECTSQVAPFGFQANFTDDRYALVIKPNAGELVKTATYKEIKSSQFGKGHFQITTEGDFKGKLKIVSTGSQYEGVYELVSKSKDKIDEYYKNYFDWINNLKLVTYHFNDDKIKIEFTQEVEISAQGYGKKSGNMLVVGINPFNQSTFIPQRYRVRKNPIEIERGFYDEDVFDFDVPEGHKIDAIPENVKLENDFGSYELQLQIVENKITVKRTLLIKAGIFPKEEYENYKKFREQIAKADNSKIVFIKN